MRWLGAARFHFVNWPEGIKDANEMLQKDGAAALQDLVVNGALPWPVAGLYRLHEIPERAARPTWNLGFPEWNSKAKLAPGMLSVVTGQPGHGKTHLFAQIWQNVICEHNLIACVATFETLPKPHYRSFLRSLYCGDLEKNLTLEQCREADGWINEHYTFLIHPEQRPTVEWFLELAEVEVVRRGAKIVLLDPWNRLESARERNESETEYVLRCLRHFHAFAQSFDVHVQIIVHPAKMGQERRNSAPLLEDISGSKHWENIPDQGFVIHRPKVFDERGIRQTKAEFFHRKARFSELGYPCVLDIELDLERYKFVPSTNTDSNPDRKKELGK